MTIVQTRLSMLLSAILVLSASAGTLRADDRPTLPSVATPVTLYGNDCTSSGLETAFERGTLISTCNRTTLAGTQPTLALPPAPRSSVLVLWAIGSIGAWQLGSAARKWNFSGTPDWFADNGPQQIGHATILDLSFTFLCNYPDALVCVVSPDRRCIPQRSEVRPPSEVVLAATAPRGPPVSR